MHFWWGYFCKLLACVIAVECLNECVLNVSKKCLIMFNINKVYRIKRCNISLNLHKRLTLGPYIFRINCDLFLNLILQNTFVVMLFDKFFAICYTNMRTRWDKRAWSEWFIILLTYPYFYPNKCLQSFDKLLSP